MRFFIVIAMIIPKFSFANPEGQGPMAFQDQNLNPALERLQKALAKNPKHPEKVLNSFWQEMKGKVWGEQHREVAQELSEKLNLQLEFSNPESPIAHQEIESLKSSLGLGSPFWILVNGLPVKQEDLDLSQAHWSALGEAFKPLIFWGSWAQFQEHLRQHRANLQIQNRYLPEKTHLQTQTMPKVSEKISDKSKSVILIAVLGFLALSLKDKKLVIRH